jgi:uroporphyrin-III C-methyltransferase / precorrin-2 dehydrogenase / sirohydrochlorin ferrochelatase
MTQGAAASLLVSLTQRSLIKRIQFVIGHDRAEALPPDLNWPAIADPAATTAIYMPTRTLAAFLRKAIDRGLPPHIPAVAICQATRADQHVETGTAATLAERVAASRATGPAIVLIGEVARDILQASESQGVAAL